MRGRRCINRRCIHSPPSARRHSFELPSTYINLKCQACLPRLTNQCLVKTLTAEGINRRNVSSPMNGSPVICDLLEARKGRSRLTFSIDVLLVYVERPCWKHQLDFFTLPGWVAGPAGGAAHPWCSPAKLGPLWSFWRSWLTKEVFS